MSSTIRSVVHLLSCPDDWHPLQYHADGLRCEGCDRQFPFLADNLVELLPKRPARLSINPEYRRAYLNLFEEQYRADANAIAWGAEESAEPSWLHKRRRQVHDLCSIVTSGTDPQTSVLCDFAAGAGHYTFAYARYFRVVLHCDLSATNLIYCRAKASKKHIKNIVFVRLDYLNPPFRNSLDRVICFDTIIRGEEHDTRLLTNLALSVRRDGAAIVDVHNWWHNPIRRVGVLTENFGLNTSYSRQSAEHLLGKAGISSFSCQPFHQESLARGILGRVWKCLIPPTRLVFTFEGRQQ